MIGLGAIDGAPLATYPLAGGQFRLEMDGGATASVASKAQATRRQTIGGDTTIVAAVDATLFGILNVRRGCSTIRVAAAATAVRRAVAHGAAAMVVASTVSATRRRALASTSGVAIAATGSLSWRFLHRSARVRTLALPAQRRTLVMSVDLRAVGVAAERRTIIVPPDLRHAA